MLWSSTAPSAAIYSMPIVHAAFPDCSWCGRDGCGFYRDEERDPICSDCRKRPGPEPKRKLRLVPPLPQTTR